jgi:hypothetical protein
MDLPITLPDWLPDWAFLLLALPVLLYALVFMMMPFSVFGVKSRLEALEAQIAMLHDEIRVLGVREPPAPRVKAPAYDEEIPDFGRLKQRVAAEPPPPPPPRAPAQAVLPPIPQVQPAAQPSAPPLSAMRDRPYLNELRAAGRRVEPRL